MPPTDVFVSYARANRPLAEQLAQGLSASGLQLWWDRDLLAGAEFAAVIELKLMWHYARTDPMSEEDALAMVARPRGGPGDSGGADGPRDTDDAGDRPLVFAY